MRSTEFLRVTFNQTLSWKEHIQSVKQKVNKNGGIIRKIRQSVPQSVLSSKHPLFHTYTSYLSYCNIVWATDKTTFRDRSFSSQKRPFVLLPTQNITPTRNHYSPS